MDRSMSNSEGRKKCLGKARSSRKVLQYVQGCEAKETYWCRGKP